MQWIKCSDKKPEYNTKVLAFHSDEKSTYNAMYCQKNGYEIDDYWICGYTGWVEFESITHWMPMPAEPEDIWINQKTGDIYIATKDGKYVEQAR